MESGDEGSECDEVGELQLNPCLDKIQIPCARPQTARGCLGLTLWELPLV